MVRVFRRALLIVGLVPILLPGFAARAATLTVNSTADDTTAADGLVTLREAILAAESDGTTDLGETGSGPDTIVFDAALTATGDATITLATVGDTQFGPSAFVVTTQVTIQGPSGGRGISLARDGGVAKLRHFAVTSTGNLTLENLTLSDGRAIGGDGGTNLGDDGGGGGGGAGLGGAIYNQGGLVVRGSTLVANTAQGGAGGAASDNVGADSGGGAGGGGLAGNGGNVPDDGSDGGAGGGGTFGKEAAPSAAVAAAVAAAPSPTGATGPGPPVERGAPSTAARAGTPGRRARRHGPRRRRRRRQRRAAGRRRRLRRRRRRHGRERLERRPDRGRGAASGAAAAAVARTTTVARAASAAAAAERATAARWPTR